MKGWLDVARISCSANARLILLRRIISFFESTTKEEIAIRAEGKSVGRGRERGKARKNDYALV